MTRLPLAALALLLPGVAVGQTAGGGGGGNGASLAINGFCPPGKSCPVDGVLTSRLHGEGEYVVEPGVALLRVTLIGAGGNGSKDGTPGGSGAVKQFSMAVKPGQSVSYSVGRPGDAGAPGGNSRFGDQVAYGGGSQSAGDGTKGRMGTIIVESFGPNATVGGSASGGGSSAGCNEPAVMVDGRCMMPDCATLQKDPDQSKHCWTTWRGPDGNVVIGDAADRPTPEKDTVQIIFEVNGVKKVLEVKPGSKVTITSTSGGGGGGPDRAAGTTPEELEKS